MTWKHLVWGVWYKNIHNSGLCHFTSLTMYRRSCGIVDWDFLELAGYHDIFNERRMWTNDFTDLYVSDYVYDRGVKQSDADVRGDGQVTTASQAKCPHGQTALQRTVEDRDCPNKKSEPPTIKRTTLPADALILIPTIDKFIDDKRSPSELLFLGNTPSMPSMVYGQWTKHWVSINSCQLDL